MPDGLHGGRAQQEAVVGTYQPPRRRPHDQPTPLAADAGIDDRNHDRARGQVLERGRHDDGAEGNVLR